MERSWNEKIFYWLLLTVSIAIPFYSFLTNPIIIFLVINWLLEGRFSEKLQVLKQRPIFVVMMIFYASHVAGLFFSSDVESGFFNLEKKLLLMIFPIVIGTSRYQLSQSQWYSVFVAFVIGTLLVSLFCLSIALYHFKLTGSPDTLVYENLMAPVGLQPIYFAMYICLSVIFLLHFLSIEKISRKTASLIILIILFFFGFILLSSARTATLAFVCIILIGGAVVTRERKAIFPFISIITILILVGFFVVRQVPFLRERVTTVMESKLYFSPKENNANGLTLRLVKWQCSLNGFKSSPIFGVGTGDAQAYLQQCYSEKEFWGQVFEFNSHNQYLQTALGLGSIGLVLLVAMLAFPLYYAIKDKDLVFILFLILISTCFLTESVLERNQGVVFFAFFMTILCYRRVTMKYKNEGAIKA